MERWETLKVEGDFCNALSFLFRLLLLVTHHAPLSPTAVPFSPVWLDFQEKNGLVSRSGDVTLHPSPRHSRHGLGRLPGCLPGRVRLHKNGEERARREREEKAKTERVK